MSISPSAEGGFFSPCSSSMVKRRLQQPWSISKGIHLEKHLPAAHTAGECALNPVKCQRNNCRLGFLVAPAQGPVRCLAKHGLESTVLSAAPSQAGSHRFKKWVLQVSRRDAWSQFHGSQSSSRTISSRLPELPPTLHPVEFGVILANFCTNPKQALNQRQHSG